MPQPDNARLSDASHLITSGSLPTWLASEELDGLLAIVRSISQDAAMCETRHDELQLLTRLLQERLCVVLCLDGRSQQMQELCQSCSGGTVPVNINIRVHPSHVEAYASIWRLCSDGSRFFTSEPAQKRQSIEDWHVCKICFINHAHTLSF